LKIERLELSDLEARVLATIRANEAITQDISRLYDERSRLSDRVADRMASFGGSWLFIGLFLSVIFVWIGWNQINPNNLQFDPYPYILLNLVLSCVAALQAPVIMMSQNRQGAKDRLRSQQDFEVNLKAELEVRQLHLKMDQLLKNQWQRLLGIQNEQMNVMNEILNLTTKAKKSL